MATPCEITIDKLNGNWIMVPKNVLGHNKKLSSEIDPIFKLNPEIQPGRPKPTIKVRQTPVIGNMASTTEIRTLDWEESQHPDYVFGKVKCWSRFVRGSPGVEDAGGVRPVFEVQNKSPAADVKRF
ncbi:hypothetical protein N7507_005100 [Penicillium longicatenatum]|nr:hypothetical protein N7507_005100 [Penicillium longicatenatum]